MRRIWSFLNKDIRRGSQLEPLESNYALNLHNLVFIFCMILSIAVFVDKYYSDSVYTRIIIEYIGVNLIEQNAVSIEIKFIYLVLFLICSLMSFFSFVIYVIFYRNVALTFQIKELLRCLVSIIFFICSFFLGIWIATSILGLFQI